MSDEKPDPESVPFRDTETQVRSRIEGLLAVDGSRTVDSFHRELGSVLWEKCGMSRSGIGLEEAVETIRALREEYWSDVKVLGGNDEVNQSLEKAGRVADYFELAELMCLDALRSSSRKKGRLCATTRTTPTSPRGNTPATARGPPFTRSISSSKTCLLLREATSRKGQVVKLTLHIWRQQDSDAGGAFETYELDGVSEHMSFLEMLDFLNEDLIARGEDPVAFDSDCREGIEPFRSTAFPVLKDLVVDRTPFDEIVQAGGFISVNTGSAGEANEIPVPKGEADLAMDAAQCIGCGACVAQCPNGAAQLFTAAKVGHLAHLPQGLPERYRRVRSMVEVMESYFGSCSNMRECEAVCPKGISVDFIAEMNRDFLKSKFKP
jgi:succinate dehydrogenase / fumarate reductase iron-sulfur subunit